MWIFNPLSVSSPEVSDFFYTTQLFGDKLFAVPDENIQAWYEYFDRKVNKAHIANYIYKLPLKDLKAIQRDIKTGESPILNSLALHLAVTKNQTFADYFVFAKEVEILLNPKSDDYWINVPLDIPEIKKLIPVAIKKAKKSKSNFLKIRYAYQAIVLLRYAGNYKKLIKYYNKQFLKLNNKKPNILNFWALAYVAYAQIELGKKEEGQKNLLKLFCNSNAKKRWADLLIDKKYFENNYNSLSAKSKFYWTIFKAYHNSGKALIGLKKTANYDANHPDFQVLLGREINKLEDWLLTREHFGETAIILNKKKKQVSENYNSDFEYLGKFIKFVKIIAEKQNVKNSFRTYALLAHLYLLQKEPKMALKYLRKAKQMPSYQPDLEPQIRYTRILANTLAAKQFDAKFEQKIGLDILWLEKQNQDNTRLFSNLMLVLHKAYDRKKMYAKAAMFLCNDLCGNRNRYNRWQDFSSPHFYLDKYASTVEVLNFINLAFSENKSALESFLFKNFKETKDRYYDLAGTIELRKDNLKKALSLFEKVNLHYWKSKKSYQTYLKNNPFIFQTESPQARKYDNTKPELFISKAFFTKKLIEFKAQYKQEKYAKRKSELAYLLATAYYNMSYSGTNWHYLAYGKASSGGELLHTGHNSFINKNYSTCSKSIQYFEQAYKLATDINQKAEFLFTLASVQNTANNFPNLKTKQPNTFAKSLRADNDAYSFYLEVCPGLKYF